MVGDLYLSYTPLDEYRRRIILSSVVDVGTCPRAAVADGRFSKRREESFPPGLIPADAERLLKTLRRRSDTGAASEP